MPQFNLFFRNILLTAHTFALCYGKDCLLTVNKLFVHRLLILFIFTLYIAEILYHAIVGIKATNPNQLMRVFFGHPTRQFCNAKWFIFKASTFGEVISVCNMYLNLQSFRTIALVTHKT